MKSRLATSSYMRLRMFNARMSEREQLIWRVAMASLFSLCLWPQGLLAKELGRYGPEYDVEEQPFIEMITERLENIDIEEANQELEQRARQEVNRPKPYKLLGRASKDRKYYFDPTITLQQDVKTPEGKVVAKKGTSVNPLEKINFNRQLYFIDSDDNKQVRWLIEQLASEESSDHEPNEKRVILTKGSPQEISKELDMRCYFDQGGVLVRKFGIKALPAKVEQEDKQLAINEYLIK